MERVPCAVRRATVATAHNGPSASSRRTLTIDANTARTRSRRETRDRSALEDLVLRAPHHPTRRNLVKHRVFESAAIVALASAIAAVTAGAASAQTVLFDFNNAPLHAPLPIDLTMGGISAHFSATGQGFSIQDGSAPVFPAGFSGRFIYPSSIFGADLLVSFDHTLTSFSILYSPQELACDDSATMRVTAYMNGSYVGTNTHVASNPGTWPVDTLSCNFAQGFNNVVVHYDSHPPTCTDYGVIFCADDMRVTPMANQISTFCFGDGSTLACPCANNGAAGHGCNNSAGTGGALMTATGAASLVADTLQFTSAGEKPTATSIFLQGNAQLGAPVTFGQGLRCTGGLLKRLYVKGAVAGIATAPTGADLSVHARSAAEGDPIAPGTTRWYETYYRDPTVLGGCSVDSTFNTSQGLIVFWSS
jgi:hypothetical protein